MLKLESGWIMNCSVFNIRLCNLSFVGNGDFLKILRSDLVEVKWYFSIEIFLVLVWRV